SPSCVNSRCSEIPLLRAYHGVDSGILVGASIVDVENKIGAGKNCDERPEMKALVKSSDARGLWLEDVPEPQVGINDVKIRVLHTGICGTDLHIYEWDEWARSTIPVPLVIGHEFVGKIVEVGANVTDYYPGDIVSGEGHV